MKTETSLVPFNVTPIFNLPTTAKLDEASIKSRDAMVVLAKGLKPITDAVSLEVASAAGVEIRRAVKDAEKRFDELKRPLLDAGKTLKAILDQYCSPLLAEQSRLEQQITLWRRKEQERIDAEIEAQRKETERLVRETDEIKRKADIAAQNVKGEKTLAKAMDMQEQSNAAQAAVIDSMTKPIPQVTKVAGYSGRRVMRIEVVNIQTVYQHNPLLCDIELRLSAVKSMFKPDEKATRNNPDKSIPGLLLFWEEDTSFRSA